MSLHTLAGHLQSAGRGDDKVLVHMTPNEVHGLQALAMAHGGSLTINPETGLPEAGFLSSILPMVAGFALNAFLPGAGLAVGEALGGLSGAAGTGILVGGGTALATGSLTKGLMAGMGAYGGAGLGEGLMAAGAPANVTPALDNPTLGGFGQNEALANAGVYKPSIGSDTFSNVANESGVNASGGLNAFNSPGVNTKSIMFENGPTNYTSAITDKTPMAEYLSSHPQVQAAPEFAGQNWTNSTYGAQTQAPYATNPSASDSSQLWNGVKRGTGSWEGAKEVWKAMPTGSGAALGMGVLGAAMDANKPSGIAGAGSSTNSLIRPYKFAYNPTGADKQPVTGSAERIYFEPTYTAGTPYKAPGPEYAAKGGIMSLAVGGPVEEMAAQNAVGQNSMYPQSQLQTTMYSNPMVQRPMPNDVITSGIDSPVDRYTGEAKFAGGGVAAAASQPSSSSKYSYDPTTQRFTETTTTTPADNSGLYHFNGQPYMKMPGIGGTGMWGGGGVYAPIQMLGGYIPWNPANQQQAPQPTVTTETTGGIMAPAIPAATASQAGLGGASQNIVPQINIPQYQTPEQQLGLQNFYPMMEQKLAERGAQMMGQGYAEGGYTRPAPMNQKMAAVDSAAEMMKTQQGLQQVVAAAKKGDQSAMLALQRAGYNMNKLNEFAAGGLSSLGGYSDGGRLLKGPGDGVSDSIPAVIGNKQPARLADGEFVVPARIVSELGNGSTEAGAKKLYAMMDRVQHARRKSVGKNKVAVNSRSDKYLPA